MPVVSSPCLSHTHEIWALRRGVWITSTLTRLPATLQVCTTWLSFPTKPRFLLSWNDKLHIEVARHFWQQAWLPGIHTAFLQ